MAEPTNPNKTKDQALEEKSSQGGDPSELSLEQLDEMILSEDPEFAQELNQVKALPSDGSVDLDVVDLDETFADRENPWVQPVGARKFLVLLLPFLPTLWNFQYRLFNRWRFFRTRLKSSFRDAGPFLVQSAKTSLQLILDFSKTQVTVFKGLSLPLKGVALGLIFACLLTFAFIYRSFTQGVVPPEKELFIASLEEWAVKSYKYDLESEMDSFYDSPRTIQNIISLPKMVVNLKASSSSGPNPMAAMEFFMEGLSPEAIIEVKDRESEMRDLFQRTIEEMTYGELSTIEGKQQLTERLRTALNAHLTKGKIRRVFIKELVLKP